MAQKMTAEQARRIEELQEVQRTMDHVKKLVTELDSSRAARSQIIDNLCGAIARELSQLRQRALTANIGTLADVAGAMSVMASRGGGINMKIRGLSDGVNSINLQLDLALKHAIAESREQPQAKTPPKP